MRLRNLFDSSNFLYSAILHLMGVLLFFWAAKDQAQAPPVVYEYIRASVVLPVESTVEPEKLPPKKSRAPNQPKIKEKPPSQTKPVSRPMQDDILPPKSDEVVKVAKKTVSKPEKTKEPEDSLKRPPSKPSLPEIDLPITTQWTSVLSKEQADLDAMSDELNQEAQAQAKAMAVRDHYAELIRNRVSQYWVRPLSARKGMQVELSLRLLPDGSVFRVKVVQSSGDSLFDRSCLQAVQKAKVLPVPEDLEIFNSSFKQFRIKFRPEDLQ